MRDVVGILTVWMTSSQKYVANIPHKNVFGKPSLHRNVSDVVQSSISLVLQHAFVTVCSPD